MMQLNTLPHSMLNVSRVCLGTMTWGEQTDETDAHAQLDYVFAHGINFIDTAEMYPVPARPATQGRTETILGKWLSRQPRDQIVIASKVAGPGRRDWMRGGRTELRRANIAEAVNDSLKRLCTDYIDLYQVHWPDRSIPMFGGTMFEPSEEPHTVPVLEQIEAMDDLIRAGKIRYYGLSNETSWGVSEFVRLARMHGFAQPISVQNCYNLLSRAFDGDLAEVCYRERLALLAYSPLAGGALTGKYVGGVRPPGARYTLFPDFGPRFRKPTVAPAIDAYIALALKEGMSITELALAFALSRWHVGAIILGATTLLQLQQDMALLERPALEPSTLAQIDAIHARFPNPAA